MSAQLTPEDLKSIEAKIAEVERQTAGEIVVHVVARSDTYAAYRLAFATLVALVTARIVSFELGGVFVDWSLEIAAVLAVLFWLLFGVSVILRGLVPVGEKGYRVHRRAQAGFIENRVHRTRDASGVLILVSMFERRVEILADEGIHQRVGVEGWKNHVERIIEGMKNGRPADGIIETIGLIGAELKSEVPIQPDDENELSNEVIVTQH